MADSEIVAEVKRLRKRVAELEEKNKATEALQAKIAELEGKLKTPKEEDEGTAFIDWEDEEE